MIGRVTRGSDYPEQFARFAVHAGLLRFGRFTTKSGRPSPYFFNTGGCADGAVLSELGGYYAAAIADRFPDATVLFGPSYKGITLAAAAAMALSRDRAQPVGFCFDRKERKEHGEGGMLVGRLPAAGDRVVIVDDVVTDGASKRYAIELLQREAGVRPTGLLVAVDRQERGAGDRSALDGAVRRVRPARGCHRHHRPDRRRAVAATGRRAHRDRRGVARPHRSLPAEVRSPRTVSPCGSGGA